MNQIINFLHKHLPLFTWKLLTITVIYLTMVTIIPDESLPPNGNVLHMMILLIAAHLFGLLSAKCSLPPLFGMLIAGFIHRNIIDVDLDINLTSTTRSLALVVILIRAGLNLDPNAIRKLSTVCVKLSLLPSIIEALIVAVSSYVWFKFNISYSLMLGFVIASVSPAVVVPGMVTIQEQKYGIKRGIPTLLIASGSVDNVFAITGVSVCLSFVFSNDNDDGSSAGELIWIIVRGPLEALAGVVYGIIVGIILWYIPDGCDRNDRDDDERETTNTDNYELHRFLLLAISSLFVWLASQKLNFKSIAPLAILTAPFVASIRWRKYNLGHFSRESLRILWIVFENFLFALIGSSVRISQLNQSILLAGLIIIIIAVLVRMAAAYLVTCCHFNRKECLFLSIAWLPKATIQAAMGPVALDIATKNNDKQDIENAQIVLTLAVLSILMTAPIGAIAIDRTYRKLLDNDNDCDITTSTTTTTMKNIPLMEKGGEQPSNYKTIV